MKKKIVLLIIFLMVISVFDIPSLFKGIGYSQMENKYNIDEGTFDKLSRMSRDNDDIMTILENAGDYPEPMLKLLAKDEDALDFVKNYPKMKNSKEVPKKVELKFWEDFPLLIQWDEKWGYLKYGDGNIGINGCAPTALSMVITGLTRNENITPYTVARYAEKNGYYMEGVGTRWALLTDGAEAFGVKGRPLQLSKSAMMSALENGSPIICSVGPGDFTSTGHFIVITNAEKGKFKVNDPNSKKNSNRLWSYEDLSHQIKSMWYYEKQ